MISRKKLSEIGYHVPDGEKKFKPVTELTAKEGNTDLALIQMKKVLALNPKLVKGHQLLALLYMKEERYDLALRALKNAKKNRCR